MCMFLLKGPLLITNSFSFTYIYTLTILNYITIMSRLYGMLESGYNEKRASALHDA